MKHFFLILTILFGFFHLSAQNMIHYSYDSAGNRTQRDTTSTNVAMSPAVDRTVVLEASYDLPSTGDFGEVVISGGGTSPEPLAGCQVLEKFWPIESQLLQEWVSVTGYARLQSGGAGQEDVCVRVQREAPSRTVWRGKRA